MLMTRSPDLSKRKTWVNLPQPLGLRPSAAFQPLSRPQAHVAGSSLASGSESPRATGPAVLQETPLPVLDKEPTPQEPRSRWRIWELNCSGARSGWGGQRLPLHSGTNWNGASTSACRGASRAHRQALVSTSPGPLQRPAAQASAPLLP
ncbi:PREDICTED: uncharacterized protein LOC108519695 [Rhinopithecus bieti]|uniref:uncharacterized protein LOC108519695 n=1 Tax=Rhinopithecus bieti TaxID=61621 RepID=UPI00083C70D1|nr:PREDICTED: uncharacterized protein LOC108519695 [Rhinopithecus bieti]